MGCLLLLSLLNCFAKQLLHRGIIFPSSRHDTPISPHPMQILSLARTYFSTISSISVLEFMSTQYKEPNFSPALSSLYSDIWFLVTTSIMSSHSSLPNIALQAHGILSRRVSDVLSDSPSILHGLLIKGNISMRNTLSLSLTSSITSIVSEGNLSYIIIKSPSVLFYLIILLYINFVYMY